MKKYEYKILWPTVAIVSFILSGFCLGLFYIFSGRIGRITAIYTFVIFIIGAIGNGPGAHRYFTHRSYKAVPALRYILMFCQQFSGLKSIISWVRVHRTHHKFNDTDKDPLNINRGLFFSCIGWGMVTPLPECQIELDRIYLDDLLSDKMVMLQYKYYPILYILITITLPTIIPYYYWGESIYAAFSMNMFRYALNLFQQFIGNGVLHWNGKKPYDKNDSSIDNWFYNILLLGEGFHNFHHAFPFDYRSNELFELAHITSLSTFFVDVCAFFGLAYDRKMASPQMIANRVLRTGDGSHPVSKKVANKEVGETQNLCEKNKKIVSLTG